MRNFAIKLNEWDEKDEDGSDTGHTIRELKYQQEEDKQDSIKDLKRWLLFKGIEYNEDLCPCFIKIFKYSHYDNSKKKNIITECKDYSDDTLLDSTVFNENNPIYISFDKSRQCTCGKMHDMKGISKLIGEKGEKQIQQVQEEYNKKIEENNKINEEKITKLENDFKEKLEKQSLLNMNLKDQLNMQSIEYDNKIKKMKKINEEENKRNKETIQNLNETLRQIDEKEKTFMQNKISAENEYNQSYLKVYDDYYKEEKENIIKEIMKEMSEFLLNNLSFEDLTTEIIPKIASEEEFAKYIRKFIKKKITPIKDENLDFNISHFNILIMGPTGVGKSTLLNKVLKRQLAKTGFGGACTDGKPQPYESNEVKGLRIWDTKGIEQGKYNINAANYDIKEAIDNLEKENDPDKFIHCIWYCVHSNRFINEEKENLKKCYNLYIKKLPIIIIYTRSDNQEDADRMIKYIEEEINSIKKDDEEEDNESIKILKVLAEDKKNDNGVIKAFGISNLMKETSKLVKLGIESSCIESLIKQNEKIIRKEFDDNINDLKIYIFNENLFEEKDQFSIKELIEKEDDSFPIFEHFDFVNFTRFICSFSAMLAKKLLHKDELKKKSLFDLYNLMKVKANDIRNNFEEIFEKKLGELTSQMAEKLDSLIHDIDSTFNISFLSSKYSINQLKIQAKNNILNNLKPDIEEQVYRKVSKILYDIYANNFSNKLMEIFHDLLNGDEPDEKLEKIFYDKGKKIMEIFYNKILKLLDYPNDDYAEKKDEKKEEGKKYKKSTKAKLREIENKAKNNKKRKINKEEEKKENEDEKNKKDEESDEREEESDEDEEEKEREEKEDNNEKKQRKKENKK